MKIELNVLSLLTYPCCVNSAIECFGLNNDAL